MAGSCGCHASLGWFNRAAADINSIRKARPMAKDKPATEISTTMEPAFGKDGDAGTPAV